MSFTSLAVASPASEQMKSKKKKHESMDIPATDAPSLAEAEEKTDGYLIKPQSLVSSLDKSTHKVRTGHYTLLPSGHSTLKHPLTKPSASYGVINLDKPSNSSTHKVVAWNKRILRAEKTGYSGTFDPKVTGNLIVYVDRTTRLIKSQQGAGKEYVCVARFHAVVPDTERVARALEVLTGSPIFSTGGVGILTSRCLSDDQQYCAASAYVAMFYGSSNPPEAKQIWKRCPPMSQKILLAGDAWTLLYYC